MIQILTIPPNSYQGQTASQGFPQQQTPYQPADFHPAPAQPTYPQAPQYSVTTAPFQIGFRFTGGAASWLGVQILGVLITVCTLGICYPWAIVMTYRWQAETTYINGYQMQFTGDAWSLFGNWVKWLLLCIVTLGIYSFWVYPRMTKWIVEHQQVNPAGIYLPM